MPVIALEVSSAAGKPPFGGVGGTIRALAGSLLAQDRESEFALCYRLERWRRGDLWRPDAPNARVRVLIDPLNGLLLRGARLLHSMAPYLPRTPRVTKLVTIHDLNAVRNVAWVTQSWHERRSAKIETAVARADHVMTYSAFTADEIREQYGLAAERVHPVLLGVDTERFAPPAAEVVRALRAKHGDYVISIGLLTARKNFTTLIEALARLPELRLLLVGRGSDGEAEVEAALDRTGMRARTLRMTGVPEPELVALIGAARVCAVPSLYEGFGLTTLEAALRRVLFDASLAADLRARGLERAREMSWQASARRLRAVYREIADV